MWPVRFARDVSTCWNSTYKLLCQSDEYKELLYDFMRYNISSIILHPLNRIYALKFVNY